MNSPCHRRRSSLSSNLCWTGWIVFRFPWTARKVDNGRWVEYCHLRHTIPLTIYRPTKSLQLNKHSCWSLTWLGHRRRQSWDKVSSPGGSRVITIRLLHVIINDRDRLLLLLDNDDRRRRWRQWHVFLSITRVSWPASRHECKQDHWWWESSNVYYSTWEMMDATRKLPCQFDNHADKW